MEIKNHGITGPSHELVCNVNGDFGQESRTYTCAFCKRGFSNAQALGGHMNVHRKDRARLQESIQESLLTTTTETTKGNDQGETQSSSDEKSDHSVPKRPWTFEEPNSGNSREKDHGVHLKKAALQLSLGIESSPTSDSCKSSNKVSCLSSSSSKEVDLELRLGMDSDPSTPRERFTRDH